VNLGDLMHRLTALSLAALLPATLAPVWAGDFDGSKNLICAPVQATDCPMGTECVAGTPDDIAFPAFIRIDFVNKAVIGPERTTAIRHLEKSDTQLLLQGTEEQFGWTLAVVQESGKMAITLAHGGGAFVLFGSCTPL